ncbi:Bud site selection protein 6 [Entomortierella lignicola]|nr:Bud site selection protein 6 [Entomortierella lignicola]
METTQRSPAVETIRRRKAEQGTINPIETTVTKLLVATKQLLEGLTLWSTRKMTEEQVSDIFVQLATQFNLASQAFHEVNIDTTELSHIPDDLRNCLEIALGEEPSPESIEQYLPRIKEIIINLLQGLRLKQNLYREQHDAKVTRTQVAASGSGRSKSNGSNFRQPNSVRSPELDGVARNNSLSAGGSPSLSVSSPDDEKGQAETLASLRSENLIKRALSRRKSHRFSTVIEQNAPRNPVNSPSSLSYTGYNSPQGSTPAASPNVHAPSFSQFPPMPTYEIPNNPLLSSPGVKRSYDAMPRPPTVPVPLPPSGYQNIPPSATSPLLGSSSMVLSTPSSETEHLSSPIPNGSAETIQSLAASTTSSFVDGSSAISPLTDVTADPLEQHLTLFLQVGKSVKKTKFEGELTHSGLRMLFMEKFQYNPGQEDFPTIYVKDPNTNIHYELESLADVKQNAFLSLNVDDLENIQRKMDQGFAALSKELHDIKKAQEASEVARHKAAAAAASAIANNASERSSPSTPDGSQMLRSVVQKVLIKNKSASASSATSPTSSEGKISASELRSQFNELQTLRRDLSVVRQLYTELQSETKTMLGSLAGYTTEIRKQALEEPASARHFIETGKVKLDKKSEDLTNKIEELQDVVEDMKINVTQRRGRPSDSSMAFVDKQCEEIGKEIEELSDYIQVLRPSWKKTWEVELQTIVKEQMFLKEQEALLEDLKDDRGSLVQTLGNLKKLLELQIKNGGTTREFVFQPIVEEGFEGLKTVLEEVKMIEPDSDKRLRAMAQMEKLRHIELSNRIDEFEEELTTFVGASKLRKTGGALEVERQRQQRDLENLKAMFASKDQLLPPGDTRQITPEQPEN